MAITKFWSYDLCAEIKNMHGKIIIVYSNKLNHQCVFAWIKIYVN